MIRQTQYDKGYAEGYDKGYHQRDHETVMDGMSPFSYWDWFEWAIYTGTTAIAIVIAILIIWLSGVYIRWQVGLPSYKGGSELSYHCDTSTNCYWRSQ
jgi:hypothetical protein